MLVHLHFEIQIMYFVINLFYIIVRAFLKKENLSARRQYLTTAIKKEIKNISSEGGHFYLKDRPPQKNFQINRSLLHHERPTSHSVNKIIYLKSA